MKDYDGTSCPVCGSEKLLKSSPPHTIVACDFCNASWKEYYKVSHHGDIKGGPTKADLVKAMGLDHLSFDGNLPQPWVNEVEALTDYEHVAGHFVWMYDDGHKLMGRPFAITETGLDIMEDFLSRDLIQNAMNTIEYGRVDRPFFTSGHKAIRCNNMLDLEGK